MEADRRASEDESHIGEAKKQLEEAKQVGLPMHTFPLLTIRASIKKDIFIQTRRILCFN